MKHDFLPLSIKIKTKVILFSWIRSKTMVPGKWISVKLDGANCGSGVVFVLFDLAYIEIRILQDLLVLHHQRFQKACFSTLDSVLLYHVGFSCCFNLLHQDGCFDSAWRVTGGVIDDQLALTLPRTGRRQRRLWIVSYFWIIILNSYFCTVK